MSANRSLTEYLDFYLGDKNLGYAVLIAGPWGNGKTFYIKNYMKCRRKGNEGDSQFVYISLNGVKSDAEIEDQIFQQLHPLLGHKNLALAGKALKGLARLGVKYVPAVPGVVSEVLDSAVDSAANIKKLIGNSENAILVFDDLERCKMSVEHVLGMINQFVEHERLRVIVLGNELEIVDEKRKPHPKYGEIKEKLFGRTFLIEADREAALRHFIDSSSSDVVRQILIDNEARILGLYRNAGYDNLRSLKQAINEFPVVYALLPEKAKKHPDVVAHILSCLIVLSLEIRKNAISLDELSEISSKSSKEMSERLLNRENRKKKDLGHFEKIEAKYNRFEFSSLLPNDACWHNFFKFGSIPHDLIDDSINSSQYFINEHTPEWQKIWHYDHLDDLEFETLTNVVRQKFDRLEYTCPGEVHHIAGLFLHLASGGFIPESLQDTACWIKSVADQLLQAGKITQDSPGRFRGHAGLGFHSRETAEFNEFSKYYETLQKKALESDLPAIGGEVFDLLKKNASEFWNRLSHPDKDQKRLDRLPILIHIDSSAFAQAYLDTPNRMKHFVGFAIQERYNESSPKQELLLELDWLKGVEQKINDSIKEGLGKITNFHARRMQKELAAAIAVLESCPSEGSG